MIKGINVHTPGSGAIQHLDALGYEWIRVDCDVDKPDKIESMFSRLDGRYKVYANIFSGHFIHAAPPGWQTSVEWIANLFGSQIKWYGIWNEPNNQRFWRGDYTAWRDGVWKPAAAIIKGKYGGTIAGPNLMDRGWYTWLKRALVDVGDDIDFVAQHFYPRRGEFKSLERFLYGTKLSTTASRIAPCLVDPAFMDVVDQHGSKPVVLAETGCTSTEVGQDKQATYLSLCYDEGAGLALDGVFWYHIQDDPRYPTRDFGIMEYDSTPKGAYYAARQCLGRDW